MDLYKAIDEMRRLSHLGIPFSVTFMSFSYARKESHGLVTICHAKLRKQLTAERNQFSDYMLQLYDCDTATYRSCWQPLIVAFNDQPVELT